MSNAYYGRPNIVGELSDAQALPNATAADSTNMVEIGTPTNGKLRLAIFANTAIAVATGQAFNIELQAFSADTAASATSFFSTANSGLINGATGTIETDAHHYIIHKTSADGALDFSAGSCIWDAPLPDKLLGAISYDFVQLVYTTDEDLSAQKIDAFIYVAD